MVEPQARVEATPADKRYAGDTQTTYRKGCIGDPRGGKGREPEEEMAAKEESEKTLLPA